MKQEKAFDGSTTVALNVRMKKRRLLSILVGLALALGLMLGMSATVYAGATTWYVGDSICLNGSYFYYNDQDSIKYLGSNSLRTVPTPDEERTENMDLQWGFRGCVPGAGDHLCNIYLTAPAGKTEEDTPTGFRIKSGTGTESDPYSFELVYESAPVKQRHNHDGITFEPWTSSDSLPGSDSYTSRSYYLTGDVTLTSTWDVPTGTTNLCLNGHGIRMNGSESVIVVNNGNTLNLYDCDTATIHKYTMSDGLAIVNDGGDKSFNGGYITGGDVSLFGGGVLVEGTLGGTFNMYGGTIIGNKGVWGGGVYVTEHSTFNMSGGTIMRNKTSNSGSGVCTAGIFNMTDGSITNNTAGGDGGGVNIGQTGTFNMTGGSITNNTADGNGNTDGGGVWVSRNNATFTVSGNARIIGNKTGDKERNVYLTSPAKINVTDKLNGSDGCIGVTMESDGVFTSGLNNGGENAIKKFFSDDNNYYVGKDKTSGEAQLIKKTPASVTKNPAAANSEFNGTEQSLLSSGGIAEGGQMQYAIGTDDKTAPTSGWSTTIPAGKDAKSYYVWYKAVGDASHTDSEAKYVTARIYFLVTFKVKGGAWDNEDKTTADKTLEFSRGADEDLALVLKDTDFPAVGDNPDADHVKAGAWDPAKQQETALSKSEVYTFKYTEKPVPTIETAPTAADITYGQTLKDSSLTGGKATVGGTQIAGTFAWTNDAAAPAVSDSGKTEYEVTFTPSDTDNYKTTTTKVKLTINARPAFVRAADQTIKEGESIQAGVDKATLTGAVSGHSLSAVTLTAQGEEILASEAEIRDAAGSEVTANYAIEYQPGTLTVIQQPSIDKKKAKISLDAGLKGTSSKDKVTAKWGKVKGASSYVICATYCGKTTKYEKIRTVNGKVNKTVIKKLAGRKLNSKRSVAYYVVAYKTVNGKNVELAKSLTVYVAGSGNKNASNVKAIKVAKKKYTLKKGKTKKIKAKLVLYKKGKKPLGYAAEFRYASSNSEVAKVSKSGKIKAVGKGKCNIYVYAQNGCAKKISVVVN